MNKRKSHIGNITEIDKIFTIPTINVLAIDRIPTSVADDIEKFGRSATFLSADARQRLCVDSCGYFPLKGCVDVFLPHENKMVTHNR